MDYKHIIAAGIILGLSGTAALAEEGSVKILAPWESSGQAFPIGEGKVAFYGVSEGIMYIENEKKGSLNAATFVCPGIRTIDLASETATSEGHCVISLANSEELIFAKFNCKGPLDSCNGKFTLTGGTGILKGVSGSGDIQVLTAMASVVADLDTGGIVKQSAGLAIWPNLSYKIPAMK